MARGFSLYLARIFNLPDDYFLISDSPVDFMAFGIVLLLTAVLAYGVRESAFIISGGELDLLPAIGRKVMCSNSLRGLRLPCHTAPLSVDKQTLCT